MTIALTALGILGTIWQMLKSSGFIGTPDWSKYVDAGLFVSQKAVEILKDANLNPGKYDQLSPEEIKALLVPVGWEELERRARDQLGLP